ncbi:MAG: hypothetical protein QOG68_1048, partial [Solirubrobacteraceae bacterium]|nr:hypothetical protein [Solirubrobacteraceae bacterium]
AVAKPPPPIFNQGESVGRFKVVSGHFRQDNGYTASYKTTPSSQNECWTYIFNDTGSANFDLSFEKGDIARMKYRGGAVTFSPRLHVTGSLSRKWRGEIQNTPGPSAGSSSCKAADFPPGTSSGCGSKNVKDAPTMLTVGLVNEHGVYGQGQDAALSGSPWVTDPFTDCPSDSGYVLGPILAESTDGAADLDDAKVGATVSLHGHGQFNSSKKQDFLYPFEWIKGSQLAHIDWTIVLKRVAEPKGKH